MLRTQRSFLQEVRDLLAIALMLMIMKSLMFGSAGIGELFSRVVGQPAAATAVMATAATTDAQTSASVETPMPSPESFALYKEHIDHINRLLQETHLAGDAYITGN